jgi:2-polyprenyl-3-methyl-5-hydroxy-6-metoxy-1,4-benzoquinol methylase
MQYVSDRVTHKSEVGYWDEFWRRASGQTSDSYYRRRLDRAVAQALIGPDTAGMSLMEVGVGGSEYLPYFHRRFGFSVSGIDYSETGCMTARELLVASGTPGEIRQGDMFKPPADLLGRFDVVVSLGLVEHFQETARAVAAVAAFARPGGRVLTVIPNMKGLYGILFKLFNRQAYDTHVPLDLAELMQAHRDCGLLNVGGEYLLGLPGVVDGGRYEPARLRRYLRKLVYPVSKAYWTLEERGVGVPENAFSSPYMICTAATLSA